MDRAVNIMNAVRVLQAAGQEIGALRDELAKMLIEPSKGASVTFEQDRKNPYSDDYSLTHLLHEEGMIHSIT